MEREGNAIVEWNAIINSVFTYSRMNFDVTKFGKAPFTHASGTCIYIYVCIHCKSPDIPRLPLYTYISTPI